MVPVQGNRAAAWTGQLCHTERAQSGTLHSRLSQAGLPSSNHHGIHAPLNLIQSSFFFSMYFEGHLTAWGL